MDQPRLGMRHPEISPAGRTLVEAPFVILYETISDTDDGPAHTVEIVPLPEIGATRRRLPFLTPFRVIVADPLFVSDTANLTPEGTCLIWMRQGS